MKISLLGRSLRAQLVAFARDESGQSTTEYVLLLLFVVLAVKQVGGTLRTRLNALVNSAFQQTEGAISSGGGE